MLDDARHLRNYCRYPNGKNGTEAKKIRDANRLPAFAFSFRRDGKIIMHHLKIMKIVSILR